MKRLLPVWLAAVVVGSVLPTLSPTGALAYGPGTEFAYEIAPSSLKPAGDSGYERALGAQLPDPSFPNRDVISTGATGLSPIKIEGPFGQAVETGLTYSDARNLDYAVDGQPIFSFGHHAFACDDERTTFTIYDIAHDGTGLLSILDLSFDTRCPGGTEGLVGELRLTSRPGRCG